MHKPRLRRDLHRRGAVTQRLSYANITSTLALVLVLGGGTAWAAHHYLITSTKQIKPSVLKALRGHRGARGANGTNGANGANGANGSRGATGATGATGSNATINGVAAGGGLTGTYPDPTLTAGSVSDTQFTTSITSVAEAGGTVTVSGTTPTMASSFDRLGLGAQPAVTRTGAGVYDVAIPGLSGYYFSHEITQITPIDNSAPVIAAIASVSGDLVVVLYDKTGAHVDDGFSFVVYD